MCTKNFFDETASLMTTDFVRHLERSILWACRLEVLAPKPGNVHPGASFADLRSDDFLRSAELAAPRLARAVSEGVGKSVLDAIKATRAEVATNTNLGIVLLIAPLAAVGVDVSLREGIREVLGGLSIADAAAVYAAIRCAQPGGMGKVSEQDVHEQPTVTLLEAMRLAADRDAIGAQYANNFWLVLEGVEVLSRVRSFPECWKEEIVRLAVWIQARVPDSLIARKCGIETAREASRRAAEILDFWEDSARREEGLVAFDAWLRGDGHRRNPGTTADLVAAVLFAAFRDRILAVPDTWPHPPKLEYA